MRYQRVLLVVPRYSGGHYRPVLYTGLGYIAESLERAGIEYDILDLGLERQRGRLKKKIEEFRPELVGLSLLSFRYEAHYKMISHLKELFPSLPIAAGGAHVSMLREQLFSECPGIDYGIVLEGERTIVELCQGKEIEEIPGLIYRREGSIFYNKDRAFIENLDAIPFPRYAKFPFVKYIDKEFNIIPIVTSRGCTYGCIYCPVPQSLGHAFRARSAGNVADEMEYWYKRGHRRFGISDDNFSYQRERVLEICDEIQKRGMVGLRISCDNGVRADLVDFDLLKRMREAGFWRLAYGAESGSNKVLRGMNKHLTTEQIEKATDGACRLGFSVRLFFLIGSPGETWEDFQDSIRLAEKYPVSEASFYTLVPFPGTRLYRWIEKNAYFIEKNGHHYLNFASGWIDQPVFQTPHLSLKARKKAFKIGQRINRKLLRASLSRKLNRFGLLGKVAAWGYGFPAVRGILKWRLCQGIVTALMRRMVKEALSSLPTFEVEEYLALSENPRVSVIIPSFDGYREGNVLLLLKSLREQSFRDLEVHVVKGVSPQGRAINLGVERAKGEILLIMDDDSRLGGADIIERLVKTLEGDRTIGMVGASLMSPPEANWLQRRAAREFPRHGVPVVDEVTESDIVCHGCCAIPRTVFEEIGGERENIIRGLDPDLRQRLRRAGYKVVLAPHTWIYHALPGTFGKLLRTFFRNGMGSAYASRFHPELVYETDERLESSGFKASTSFSFRCLRFPFRLLGALLSLKFVRFFGYSIYGLGFVFGMIRYRRNQESINHR